MRRAIPTERLEGLRANDRSLGAAEAAARLARYGFNDIVEESGNAWRELVRDTLRDPMLWFLLATATLFAFLGDRAEAITLLVAIVPLIGMDAYLHRRTQASTRGLKSRLADTARVLRDGIQQEIPARELAPGDLVEVAAGQPFPADGVILAGENLQADESVLTGESLPVRKQPCAPQARIEPQLDDLHWASAGTRLLTGRARVRIVFTGRDTLYGEIVRLALQGTRARTPLQSAIGRLVAVLLLIAALMCIVLAAIRWWQGHGLADALLSAITLAVAAIPEEFPVVFTFFLGAGVYRLARRRALVRRAVAVENIGRITCICSDKTGTMTEGRLVLAHREPAAGISDSRLGEFAVLAAREDSGDPLDVALREATPAPAWAVARTATFPFTEARRRECAAWRTADGSQLLALKGAPETVLARSTLDAAARDEWLERVAGYARDGHKVIAIASRPVDVARPDLEPEAGFEFLGLLAFEDPLRPGVRDAVLACARAGIRVIMVTGDHPTTAAAIAREAGLGAGRPDLVVLDDSSADASRPVDDPARIDVVARALPARKLELVKSLQAQGEIVAVTGDGVNDVPALQAADIGIAMGERGTQSAREVAAIVLLDDNFKTIVDAIGEGRQLFVNLQASFAYLLMVHIPLVLTAAIVPLLGYPLLYLPIHIVWLELLIHPTALLAFQDRAPPGELARVMRARGTRFYDLRNWSVICLAGLAATIAVVSCYLHVLRANGDVAQARALALAVLIIAGATAAAVLSRLDGRAARLMAAAAVASLLLMVQWPTLAAWVQLQPLDAADWALATGCGVLAGGLAALISAKRDAGANPGAATRAA